MMSKQARRVLASEIGNDAERYALVTRQLSRENCAECGRTRAGSANSLLCFDCSHDYPKYENVGAPKQGYSSGVLWQYRIVWKKPAFFGECEIEKVDGAGRVRWLRACDTRQEAVEYIEKRLARKG